MGGWLMIGNVQPTHEIVARVRRLPSRPARGGKRNSEGPKSGKPGAE